MSEFWQGWIAGWVVGTLSATVGCLLAFKVILKVKKMVNWEKMATVAVEGLKLIADQPCDCEYFAHSPHERQKWCGACLAKRTLEEVYGAG